MSQTFFALFGDPLWGPLLIFSLRIVDVSLDTMRVIFLVRGKRTMAALPGPTTTRLASLSTMRPATCTTRSAPRSFVSGPPSSTSGRRGSRSSPRRRISAVLQVPLLPAFSALKRLGSAVSMVGL